MKSLPLFLLSISTLATLSFSPLEKKYIVIDAGHGGMDAGASHNGVYEKDLVLNIAKQIKANSEKAGKYEVILTREDDSYPSLSDRTNKINEINPEMVISLHVNKSAEKNTEKSGQEIFIQKNEESKCLAERLSQKLGFSSIKEGNLHLLRVSKAPTMVVEIGSISNTKERVYISSEKGQQEIAVKISEFINEN